MILIDFIDGHRRAALRGTQTARADPVKTEVMGFTRLA